MEFIDLLPETNLNEIETRSLTKTQVLLKHSTRCIVSSMALMRLRTCTNDADCWVLDLLRYRELSNEIAQRYDIPHQSPQIIVLQKGKVVFNASHEQIDCEKIP
jgi:bacillithiol system protein YtxJ